MNAGTASGIPGSAWDVGLLDPLGAGSRAAELTSDSAWLQAVVDVELALTLALINAGLVPEEMHGVCDRLADAGSLDLAAIAAEGRGGGNPVISLVKHLEAAAEAVRAGASDHTSTSARRARTSSTPQPCFSPPASPARSSRS